MKCCSAPRQSGERCSPTHREVPVNDPDTHARHAHVDPRLLYDELPPFLVAGNRFGSYGFGAGLSGLLLALAPFGHAVAWILVVAAVVLSGIGYVRYAQGGRPTATPPSSASRRGGSASWFSCSSWRPRSPCRRRRTCTTPLRDGSDRERGPDPLQRPLRVARRPALESDDAVVAEAVQRRRDRRVVDLAGARLAA